MLSTGPLKTRRDAMRDLGLSALALAALSTPADAAGKRNPLVRGRVYDGNSLRKQGLSGVMVSNGRDVVLTDDHGAYALPVAQGSMVFAIKPPHWTYPETAGVPRIGYLVDSIDRDRAFVSTVRPGARNVDFSFVRAPEGDDFDVLMFTDTHAGNMQELGYVREMIRRGRDATDAAFAIHHGDALADDLSMFPAYREMLAQSRSVWHHCPGNHDLRLGMRDPRLGADAWMRELGPTHYAFRCGRATFILLNNVDDLGPRVARHDPRPYRGFVSRDQLRFVSNVLRHVPKTDLVVLSMHIPLESYINPNAGTDTTLNRAALMQLLADRPNTISFAGHSHTTEHHYLGRGSGYSGAEPHHHHVLTAASGSWWSGPLEEDGVPMAVSRDGSPKGHHVLSISGNRASTRFMPHRPDQQVRAVIEERRLLGAAGLTTALVNGRLFVNVFDGGPRTKVSCRIESKGGDAVVLTRTATADPFIVDVFARDRSEMKPWVFPATCSHLWTADIPPNLPPGTHRISVETEGEFGQRHGHDLSITV